MKCETNLLVIVGELQPREYWTYPLMSDFLKSCYGVLKLYQDMKLHASTMVQC